MRPAFGQQQTVGAKKPRPAFGQQQTVGATQPRPAFGQQQNVGAKKPRPAFGQQQLFGGTSSKAPRSAFGGKTGLVVPAKNKKVTSRWKAGGLKAAKLGFSNRAEGSTDPKVLRGAGMTSYKTGDFEKARTYLQKIVSMNKDDWAAQNLKEADIVDAKLLRALAVSHYTIAKQNAAIVTYDHDANFLIYEAAQTAFAPALRHMENAADPALLLQAGKCYEGLADWDGALTIYGSIIAGFPRYEGMTTVVLRAVAVMAQTGQMATAAAYCEKILDLPPPELTQDDMMFVLARVYELAGRSAEAQDTYKEVHRMYNKRQIMLKQREHQRREKGLKKLKHEEDDELRAWLQADREGPSLDCVNYGEFRAWRTWYENPETWRRRMKRYASVLDLPIFAADANVEVLRREQAAGNATTATWLSLSQIKYRLRDSAVSLQAALKALDLDRYNKDIRTLVATKDPTGWAETFKMEEKNALDIQRVLCRGTKGRWLAFRKRNEFAMMNNSATFVQRVRRGQLGRRTVHLKREQIRCSIVIQTAIRRKLAYKRVSQIKQQHASARVIQRRARVRMKRVRAAIKIQAIMRGVIGKNKADLRRRKIVGAIKMQGLFRSYKWRKIAREIRIARDAAVSIQRLFRGFVARTYFYYIRGRFIGARGVQRVGRGWRVRRRVRNLKSTSASQIQRLVRGHFGRNRCATLRSAVRHHLLHTPVVQLMRSASVEADCSWLSQAVFQDIHYLNDAFSSSIVVSETSALTTKDAKRISAMLYKNSMVKTLVLSSGNMSDEGATSIASSLQYNTSLRTLAFGPNDIGPRGAEALAATLKNHNYSLRHLCLDFNPLGSVGVQSILSACGDFFCRNYGQLQRLTLSACGVDDSCASCLGDLLYMNRRLMYLDLSGNRIADVAVKDLGEALKNNSTLVGLDLRGNMIRSEGASLLAECLLDEDNQSSSLQLLRLDCNIVLDDGALDLLHAFEESESLRALTMDGNPIGRVLLERFVMVGDKRVMGNEDPLSSSSSSPSSSYSTKIPEQPSATSPGKRQRQMKTLPTLKLQPVRRPPVVVRDPSSMYDDGTPFMQELRGRASFEPNQPEIHLPLSLDSIIPPEMRHAYVSIDGPDADSLARPLRPVSNAPVTYPSPSVPHRLYRRRRSPVRVPPRHTAKPRPNVFVAMVSPPAMHVNPIHAIDSNIIQTNRRHLISRSEIQSQPRNLFGGPRW